MNDVLPEIIEFDDRKYLVQILPNNPGKKNFFFLLNYRLVIANK